MTLSKNYSLISTFEAVQKKLSGDLENFEIVLDI